MDKKGFTLIELLITVAIIGILAAIAIPAYIGQQKNAARTEAFTNLQNLSLLEAQFFAERGIFTKDLGENAKDKPNNVMCIQTGRTLPSDAADSANQLPGFKPGSGLSFSYWILTNNRITDVNKISKCDFSGLKDTTTDVPPTRCFTAVARGNTVGRVPNECFAIDCNNNKNF